LPKRKIREEKPKKRLGKKELLIVPVAMGGATLFALVLVPTFWPPPVPIEVCLKAINVETFQLQPRVQVIVDGEPKLLPETIGRETVQGQECIRPIRTDEVGDVVQIEYIRPVRLNIIDFMKVYAYENDTLIDVVDNSTGVLAKQTINLTQTEVEFSYNTDQGFVSMENLNAFPPFSNDLVVRMNVTSLGED
jgi:hypothetical protein